MRSSFPSEQWLSVLLDRWSPPWMGREEFTCGPIISRAHWQHGSLGVSLHSPASGQTQGSGCSGLVPGRGAQTGGMGLPQAEPIPASDLTHCV